MKFHLAAGLWRYKQFSFCFWVVNLEHTDFKLNKLSVHDSHTESTMSVGGLGLGIER